jgi:hypothetical protein
MVSLVRSETKVVTHSLKISATSSPDRCILPSERSSTETDNSDSTDGGPGGVAGRKGGGKINSEAGRRSANTSGPLALLGPGSSWAGGDGGSVLDGGRFSKREQARAGKYARPLGDSSKRRVDVTWHPSRETRARASRTRIREAFLEVAPQLPKKWLSDAKAGESVWPHTFICRQLVHTCWARFHRPFFWRSAPPPVEEELSFAGSMMSG